MRKALDRVRKGCAIIAVIALYALLLQPFLAALAPAPAAGLAGAICAGHGDPEHAPAAHDHECCPATTSWAAPPAPTSVPVRWPTAEAAPERPEARLPATGPPPRPGGARAPPLA